MVKRLKINLERTVETLRLTDTKILGIVQRVRGGKNDGDMVMDTATDMAMEMNNLNGDNKMNKTVLVTGGAGFIGSHIVERHLNEGNDVVVVDDLSMGLLENLPENDNLTFFEKSITDTKFMNDLLVKYNFDYIYLLAAIASVADTIERPYESHQVNQEANIAILENQQFATTENSVFFICRNIWYFA